jgi:hypothetical protein
VKYTTSLRVSNTNFCVSHRRTMCVSDRRTIGLPLSQVLCSANVVGQRGPITPSHTQMGSTGPRENPATEEATPHFTICAAADTQPTGTRNTADSGASLSGARRPRLQPGAAAHRRKRHEVLTHIPAVAAKAPGASSIHGACARVASFRSRRIAGAR